MELINGLQTELLEALGRFGFLTVSLCHTLTGKSVGYIREMVGSLSRRGYIGSYRIEISYKVRAENVYFLKPLGVEFLQSHKAIVAADIIAPVAKNPVVTKDYHHRMACIAIHLHWYMYCKSHAIPLRGFYSYFDKTGSVKAGNLTAKTKIPLEKDTFYIPDLVAVGDNKLWLFECYMDRDSKRVINQLALHAKAISLGTPANAFGLERVNPLILSVFAHAGIKQAVIKKLHDLTGFDSMSHLFFFATLDDLKQDIGTAFSTIHDTTLIF